jgi:hypothetical protein
LFFPSDILILPDYVHRCIPGSAQNISISRPQNKTLECAPPTSEQRRQPTPADLNPDARGQKRTVLRVPISDLNDLMLHMGRIQAEPGAWCPLWSPASSCYHLLPFGRLSPSPFQPIPEP